MAGRDPSGLLVQISRECTLPYLSTGISNLLQPAQAEVMLGQRSMYLASWLTDPACEGSAYTLLHGHYCSCLVERTAAAPTGWQFSDFKCEAGVHIVKPPHIYPKVDFP